MSSISPAAVTRPAPRPSVAEKTRITVAAIVTSLPSIIKQMMMMVVAAFLPVALVMLCVASPPYYDLKLTRENKLLGNGTTAQEEGHHDLPVQMGLEYFYFWRAKFWGLDTTAVSVFLHPVSSPTVFCCCCVPHLTSMFCIP
jgi:hypothetical protein